MDLLSVFKRKPAPAEVPASEAADAVQLTRTRARQRLIGAAVLVVAGIIGFPLLFETQPRPLPVDLPIEIPRKDAMAPLAMPGAATDTPKTAAKPPPSSAAERVITETQAEAGREVAASTPPAVAAASAASAAVVEPAAKAKPPAARASAPAAEGDGARAKALLEGKAGTTVEAPSTAASSAARFIVQVGAFADPVALKDARAKVEKLGLKTYTQVAETPAGPRTRVRVGPFETRDEAERAAAKIKAGAMPAVILAL